MGGIIMSELYWISVIGKLNTFCWILFGISVGAVAILFILYFINDYEDDQIKLVKPIKRTIISTIVCGLCGIFIPGKNETYFIYGAGTIVDYCKDSPKVKEVPDKAIDALNRYIDSIAEDKKE